MSARKDQDVEAKTEAKTSALIKLAPALILIYCLLGGDLLNDLGILPKPISKLVGWSLAVLVVYWALPAPRPSYKRWVILGLLLLAGCFVAFDLAPVWLGSFLPTPLAVSLPLSALSVAVYLVDRSYGSRKGVSFVKWGGLSLLLIAGYTILVSLSRR